ncbi:MAG TPA: pentapeptide repeat-containing protein [Nostoc sp.]|uniref:pentapeptide repeat-containing protein n=1 Tax=Nostoc sp. TaxID=1180 RepID=UPI002D681ECC|nr:pentapeptide repeat-containing protein [Nostoc sp.]HYX13922.1 pentapeptide repeat-containing protein [Nostoc sp.]
MSDKNTDPLRNWLIVLPFIFIVCLFIVFLAFVNVEGLSTEQRLDYGIKALTTTGTIFVGIAVFINAFYAAKRAEAMDKSAEAANKSAEAANKSAEAALRNAEAAQDKQITERFEKAIEQLGNEKIETRLGAIYTLERIAKDSKDDHWTIMEVLTAFVRENAPLNDFFEKNTENTDSLIIVNTWNYQKPKEIEEKLNLQTDIQAALTVIGRRKSENDPENQRLDLRNINIRGAVLFKANLQNANLMRANLQGAILSEAKLQGVILTLANLQGAKLPKANLEDADLSEANLQEAILSEANLQGAKLPRANLEDADLSGANLQKAILTKANLQGAKLPRANLEDAILIETNLQGATLTRANLQVADLSKANLGWARLSEANLGWAMLREVNLQGAKLSEAKNLEQEQIELAKGDRTTILPENLQPPKHWRVINFTL